MLPTYSVFSTAVAAMLSRMAPSSSHHWIGRDPGIKPKHDRRTSRYMPHQGQQEMARRRRQMMKAHGKCPVVRFYALLSGGGE